MSNSTNDMPEKLLQYLDGELQGNERAEMETQLAANKSLREELESLELTREAVRSYGLKQEVAGVHQQMMKELQAPVKEIGSTRRIIRYSMSVAAGLILIIAGITSYNYFSLTPAKLFNGNYRSYELSTVRDGGTEEISPVEKAYREKKYADAVAIAFERPFNIKEDFLRAMSYTELGENDKAITSYKDVIGKNNAAGTQLLVGEAEYYLALVYVRAKEYDKALELMDKINENPGHPYHDKISSGLIRKVKRLR